MENFPGFTNQGIPFEGNPGPFPAFGNVGTPYMATFSLLGLAFGLPIWLFSTLVVPSALTYVQMSPSPEQHHVDYNVDPSPSSPISSPCSSSSPGESMDSNNLEAKKKNKRMKKMNQNKQGETKQPFLPM